MNTAWIGMAFTALTLFSAAPAGADVAGDPIVLDASATVAIEIPEVECAGCSLEARKAVKGAGGVLRLNEGSPKNRLVVTYEPGPGRPTVYVEALRKAGFPKAHDAGG